MHAEFGKTRLLRLQDLFEIRHARFEDRSAHLRWREARDGDQHRSSRNQDTDIVRRELHRVLHLPETLLPELHSILDIAGLKCRTG